MTLKNSNCDETQKLKWEQNSKFQIVTNSKTQIMTKLKETQAVRKLKLSQNSNCNKTQNVTKLKL